MRTSTSILALGCLVFGTGALAQSAASNSFDAIFARHENDLSLERRGLMTEFEARAILISRASPNGGCSGVTQEMNFWSCYNQKGHGWKIAGRCYGRQQMLLQTTPIKGSCYL
ncbi:hypothetical protein B0H34DRAFT_796557 [Crassisporium funariophilum]|nr:hypothetical protein B0H34DRAFT_796557 [Crassisporium funariophilum]